MYAPSILCTPSYRTLRGASGSYCFRYTEHPVYTVRPSSFNIRRDSMNYYENASTATANGFFFFAIYDLIVKYELKISKEQQSLVVTRYSVDSHRSRPECVVRAARAVAASGQLVSLTTSYVAVNVCVSSGSTPVVGTELAARPARPTGPSPSPIEAVIQATDKLATCAGVAPSFAAPLIWRLT
ncbi:hypothetical protein EVAR_60190_1 [Eumeta japonica]|uniref:Uncharacterized protein n=1 Tax=Eumeta variegata TaxID=151549 RepID=A0A4C1ZC95_EUMVA|nr:hypothetical protein EVAR_60190_1 [Eumeta japonica]